MQLVNMHAAIEGYRLGKIPYSSTYTIIYAGHIVDTSPDHASTVIDRLERLEAYAAEHGAGAIWFEPPCPATLICSAEGCLPGESPEPARQRRASGRRVSNAADGLPRTQSLGHVRHRRATLPP